MKISLTIPLSFLLLTSLYADIDSVEIASLLKERNLYAGAKATVQWERVFSSKRRLDKYGLSQLTKREREALKKYLIKHAADSQQPIVPGL